MRGAQLPPVKVTNGHHLRIAMAKAISEIETYGKRASAEPAALQQMLDFLSAAETAVNLVKAYPASVAVTGADVALSLATDQTEQLTATATGLGGATANVSSNAETVWTSSDPTKATVSATGLVTAVAVGSVTITAQYKNKVSNALAVTVAA